MTAALLSLGDSVSCGEGVGVQVPLPLTWVGLLADACGADLIPLAAPGARVRDVRAAQLPLAPAGAPVATLLIGLNDVIRAGFDPAAVRVDLLAVVAGLRASGSTVLVARLHDPTALLPLPAALRRQVAARVSAVNSAVDAAAAPGVLVLDLAAIPGLRRRRAWAVDRMHPSPAGHQAIVAAAGALLTASGWPPVRRCRCRTWRRRAAQCPDPAVPYA